MTAALDYIPEYLSEEAKRKLAVLATESTPEPGPVELNEYLIRHWCETLEDGNPLYLDDAYARSQGRRSIVAPVGSIMTTLSMPLRWPWPPGDREPARHIHYDVKDLLNLPVGIITTIEVEQHAFVEVGDRVRLPPLRRPETSGESAPRPPSPSLAKLVTDSIVYEDADLLVLNKPAGVAVHGGSGMAHGVIEVLRAVRADARTHTVPVVMVTASGSESVAVAALKNGASDYVVKTGSHGSELARAVELAAAKHRLEEMARLAVGRDADRDHAVGQADAERAGQGDGRVILRFGHADVRIGRD